MFQNRIVSLLLQRSSVKLPSQSAFFYTKINADQLENKLPIKKERSVPAEFRFVYPEFLPDPKVEWRNGVREKLERNDMLNRRANVDVPEFYVGSILAVTNSDNHAVGKTSRFVGICISRDLCGLRANFILRNVIDHQGIEVLFELYDPTIQKIEVLKIEKRLDSKLFYLRDALPKYSTFDVNMEAENLPENSEVPVNDLKVQLKPRPWLERWERQNLQGVENIDELLYDKHRRLAAKRATPWEKYDLMKEYRRSIPEQEQKEVYSEIYSRVQQIKEVNKKKFKRRTFVKPNKLA